MSTSAWLTWFLIVYGESDTGKTVDVGKLAGRNAVFLNPTNNQLASLTRTAVPPSTINEVLIDTFANAEKWVKANQHSLKAKGTVVVLDDATTTAMTSWAVLAPSVRDGRQLWPQLKRQVVSFLSSLVAVNACCAAVFHESPPHRAEDGSFTQGGPAMAARTMQTFLPAASTLCLRAKKTLLSDPTWDLWPGKYWRDSSDTQWYSKDRYGVLPPGEAPMNLREILIRANELGHRLFIPPRFAGVEYLDDVAESVARGIAAGRFQSAAQAAKALQALPAMKDKNLLHLRWGVQDGVARHQLRAAGDPLLSIFDTTARVGTAPPLSTPAR